jgi:hypothetical protein
VSDVLKTRVDISVRFILSALLVASLVGTRVVAETRLRVIYPKPDQAVGAIDSTFIFGSVSGDFNPRKDWLEINGHIVEVHSGGGFLAYLPTTPGEFTFHVRALRQTTTPLRGEGLERFQLLCEDSVRVFLPVPRQSLPDDSLAIAGDYAPLSGDLVLSTGGILRVMFQATPGLYAWFAIPGVVDSVSMSEVDPRQQPYWGEAVFGVGAVPDSVLIKGIYSGLYVVPESVSVVDAQVIYNIATPPHKYIRPLISTTPSGVEDERLVKLLAMPAGLARPSGYRVSLNHPDYPFTVRFLDSVQTLRHGPQQGYFSIFQPQGAEALVVGGEGDWFRLKLSRTQYAWADRNSVMVLPGGTLPPVSRPTSIRSYAYDDYVLVEIGLSGKHPFRVIEDDARTLRVQLFGVTSNTDWIRYDFSDPLIDLVTWSQPEPDLYEIKLRLTRDIVHRSGLEKYGGKRL